MTRLAGLALAAAGAVIAATGAANAADLWVPPVRGSVVEPVPVEFGSNWYLRGDVGYRMNEEPAGQYTAGSVLCALCSGPLFDEDLDDSWAVGVGAGYRFSPWLRADVTADYMAPAEFSGSLDSPLGVEAHRADISTWTILANAYVDLGTWERITPYVGAGVGVANHRLSDYAVDGVEGYFDDSEGGWNLAWAAMAGVAYDVTPNLSVDVGYRYLSMGEVSTHDTVGNSDILKIDDFTSHEARIGVRYMMN